MLETPDAGAIAALEGPPETSHPLSGLYDVAHFEADGWRPRTRPGHEQMTERDAHWMARKSLELGPEILRAIRAEGQLSDRAADRRLLRTILGRREAPRALLLTWTPGLTPRAEGRALCVDDHGDRRRLTDRCSPDDARGRAGRPTPRVRVADAAAGKVCACCAPAPE